MGYSLRGFKALGQQGDSLNENNNNNNKGKSMSIDSVQWGLGNGASVWYFPVPARPMWLTRDYGGMESNQQPAPFPLVNYKEGWIHSVGKLESNSPVTSNMMPIPFPASTFYYSLNKKWRVAQKIWWDRMIQFWN